MQDMHSRLKVEIDSPAIREEYLLKGLQRVKTIFNEQFTKKLEMEN